MTSCHIFRLTDVIATNEKSTDAEEYEESFGKLSDSVQFKLQLFGTSTIGETYAVKVEGYFPFFYVLVGDNWGEDTTARFLVYLRKRLGGYYRNGIISCKTVHQKKMYGFDEGNLYKFLRLEFKNIAVFNKVKRYWYNSAEEERSESSDIIDNTPVSANNNFHSKLKLLSASKPRTATAAATTTTKKYSNPTQLKDGLVFESIYPTKLYEAQILPLLRFLHIFNISPSGFVRLVGERALIRQIKKIGRQTNATYEFIVDCSNIEAVSMDEPVPYKIMSFDIEASSSHGDFPVPIKSYKKLATNIYDYFHKNEVKGQPLDTQINYLVELVLLAFGYKEDNWFEFVDTSVEIVYPKLVEKMYWRRIDNQRVEATRDNLRRMCREWLTMKVAEYQTENYSTVLATHVEESFIQKGKERQSTPYVHAETDENDDDENELDEDSDNNDNDNDNNNDNDKTTATMSVSAFNEEEEEVAVGPSHAMLAKKSQDAEKQARRIRAKSGGTAATIVDVLRDTANEFDRETIINELNVSMRKCLPQLEGDKVTFIGSTFTTYGESVPYKNHCIVLNTCAAVPVENAEIEVYFSEREVLLAWQAVVQRENPDIVIGYNIFGFDYEFLFRRAEENNCSHEFLKFSRNVSELCAKVDYETKQLSLEEKSIQIASGVHEFKFIPMNGRVQIDLYNHYRREENLSSYKLDYVAGHFIGDYIKKCLPGEEEEEEATTVFYSENLVGLSAGCFVHFEVIAFSVDYFADGAKFRVLDVLSEEKKFIVEGSLLLLDAVIARNKVRWCLAKDDVTPKDIFRLSNGTAEDRAVVAKYCIQDCNLVHHLFNKSDILTGFIEMANICSVPINFLVLRGQGIKLTSFVAKKCREKNTLLPVLDKCESDEGYEGAFVLPPKKKIYFDDAVACLDFASLYPSVILSENLSHDTKVWTKEYDRQGNLVKETGVKRTSSSSSSSSSSEATEEKYLFDNLPGYTYVNVSYDTFAYVRKSKTAKAVKTIYGHKVCRYVQPIRMPDGTVRNMGILPAILQEILKMRKDTRKLIPLQPTEFLKRVFDQRQLGYKKTANSLYGNCGARTSTFYEKDIAACTTATGRNLLLFAKRIVEEGYRNRVCATKRHGDVLTNAEYIYGDTDSVFFTFNLRDTTTGARILGKDALEITIELAQQAGRLASAFLKQPHDLEYEKTFQPFILLAMKKYVGILYEKDIHKGKRKDAGNVSQRRDNAPIVKDIFGGCVESILKEKKLTLALTYLEELLQKVYHGELPIEKFVISKSLRTGYKNPQAIPQKVLADRMAVRDPGNKPAPGDRIPYVYVVTKEMTMMQNKKKKLLQGDRIETPTYIAANPQIKIDYAFYITNQIMKPVLQLFALELEAIWDIWEQQKKGTNIKVATKMKKYDADVDALRAKYGADEAKLADKIEELRQKEVKILLFDEIIRKDTNQKNGNQEITTAFSDVRTKKNGSTLLKRSKRSQQFCDELPAKKNIRSIMN